MHTLGQTLNQRPFRITPTGALPKLSASAEAIAKARVELDSVEHVPDELILGLSSQFSPSLEEQLAGAIVERFPVAGNESDATDVVRVKLPPGSQLADYLGGFKEMVGVVYAEPNQIYHLSESRSNKAEPGKPNDLREKLWGLSNKTDPEADIDALKAWQITTGSKSGPLIAVIDSGADYNHPDLRANIAVNSGEIPDDGIDNDGNGVVDDYYGFNAFENTGDPMDGIGHGTHVTGTIAAVGNNGQGVVGVNWQAQVLPVKIFHDRGMTTTDAILRGLNYAKERGATITSNSWGGSSHSKAIHDAFESFPALHIAAAGNQAKNTDQDASYPANYDISTMISVGASNRHDSPSWFSNYGRRTVDLFAPGEDIYSTIPGGGYGDKSGTSMATPHVSGVAGLVATRYPHLDPEEIKDRLLFSSDPRPHVSDLSVSGGRLNAHKALSDDSVPPAAPNDFVATQASPKMVRFSWTGTGDDGWKNGAATGFEVRTSPNPITSATWQEATPLDTPRGGEIGDHLHAHYTQTPRSKKTKVYAAFQAIDEAGNRSPLLTTEAAVPPAPMVFRDDFDSDDSTWNADGRWALRPEEGRGRVWSSKHSGTESGAFSTLSTPPIDLSQRKGAFLRFESRQDFSWANNVFVEIAESGSDHWSRLGELEDRGQWMEREFDLSAHDGKNVSIRIRSENLGSKEGDGMMVDKFEILSEVQAILN